ncbi:Mu transposase C-terminal domain-containing protein [Streptomyces sp. NPDC004111]|uniref:Mu transposase C-terminal domain-containing protein n=1 Tax=Streptomyces sp. NPDC004111 TaxID=3364690 RepID=UPI0036CC66B3
MMTIPENKDLALRRASVQRLLHLADEGTLTSGHLKTVANSYGVRRRTVTRWVENARAHQGTYTPSPRPAFTLDATMRDALARWCGNIAGAHRELTAEQGLTVSYNTFNRAVTREMSPGFLAGLRGGERDRRKFDVFNERERGHRNAAWEGDHTQANVWVNVAGQPRKPWITWFVDCATNCICGLAITPQTPARDSILACLRDALLRDAHHGPFGGQPTLVRIDGGKDFLSQTVAAALGVFGVRRVHLPPYSPELKGTVEVLNNAIKTMAFPCLPGYVRAPRSSMRKPSPPTTTDNLLTFEDFVSHVRNWVHFWNYEHRIRALGNRTPAEAWREDLTPIYDIPSDVLHTYTLELAGKLFTINGSGVQWGNRRYVATWMSGRRGAKVRLRHMPHHYHQVHLYEAVTGAYLGPADLQNGATLEQKRAIVHSRRQAAEKLRQALKRANKSKNERFSPGTATEASLPLSPQTDEQAEAELRAARALPAVEPTPDIRPLPALPHPHERASGEAPTPETHGHAPRADVRPLPALPSPAHREGEAT